MNQQGEASGLFPGLEGALRASGDNQPGAGWRQSERGSLLDVEAGPLRGVSTSGAGQRLLPASGQGIQTETIVQAELDDIDIAINIHPVVFDLGRPVVLERIFGANAEQQSTRCIV